MSRRRIPALLALIGLAIVGLVSLASCGGSAEPAARLPSRGMEIAVTHDGEEITVLGADGKRRTVMRFAAHPAWSPDGKKIAFEREAWGEESGPFELPPDDLWVMNADGGGEQRLTTAPAEDHEAAWSPDGKRIAFSSAKCDDCTAEIFVMNADGSGQHALTTTSPEHDDDEPTWSPNGRRIAFGRNGEIWVMNSDGSGQHRLTRRARVGDPYDGEPAWSPDGNWIAFERVFDTGKDEFFGYFDTTESEIWLVHRDGTALRRLIAAENDDPAWRPPAGRR